MKRFLLDTGVAGDLVHKRGIVSQRAASETRIGNRVGVAMPTVGELFAGVENSQTRERNHVKLVRALTEITQWPFDRAAAEEFGRLFAHLKRVGRPMQQIDIQIAAVAITFGCTVVTKD